VSKYQSKNVAKHALTGMEINMVSLCGRGIHEGATVEIFKSADAGVGPTASAVHVNRPLSDERKKLRKEVVDDMRRRADSKKRAEERRKHLAEIASKDEKSSTGNQAVPTLQKSSTKVTHTGEEDMPDFNLPDDLDTDTVEYIGSLEDRLLKAEADLAEAVAKGFPAGKKAAPFKSKDAEPDADDMKKSLDAVLAKADPALAEYLRKQADDLAATEARLAKAEAHNTAMAEASIRKAAVAKAESYTALGVDAAAAADVLVELHKSAPDLATKVETMLDAAAEAVSTSDIFKEYGRPGALVSGSKADELAKALRAVEPSLSEEAALAKAYEDNPDLYNEYLVSKGA
jgi:hypothetical protein